MTHSERWIHEENPYWTAEIGLFEGRFRYTRDEPRMIRARVHEAGDEHYSLSSLDREIVPVSHKRGIRTYFHIEPYLAEPDIRLTVSLRQSPRADDGAIGTVTDSEIAGLRKRPVGKAQAWYYSQDNLLCLWECFLDAPFRDTPLLDDANMRRLWLSIEDFLQTTTTAATQIVTPFRDPLFPDADYQAFLASLDYEPIAKAAWGKHIP